MNLLSDTDGKWGEWSEWSSCDKDCDGGVQKRNRSCNSGMCDGPKIQTQECNTDPCEDKCNDWRGISPGIYAFNVPTCFVKTSELNFDNFEKSTESFQKISKHLQTNIGEIEIGDEYKNERLSITEDPGLEMNVLGLGLDQKDIDGSTKPKMDRQRIEIKGNLKEEWLGNKDDNKN
eukprot:Pgem_evm1s14262